MTISIVGLGPGPADLLTLEARRVLDSAPEIWLRTRVHPLVGDLQLGASVRSFDHYYEEAGNFTEVYERICADLERMAATHAVVYAVPGHPLVGEATVRRLVQHSREGGAAVRIVAGLSFIEPVCAALDLDPLEAGLQIVDALRPDLEPERPAICAQLYSRAVASALKLLLLDLYPAEHEVTLVSSAGLAAHETVWRGPLSALDHAERFDHLSTLYLPALAPALDRRTFAGLRGIVHRLYAPDGCPWDREQTHTSLRPYLLEETYEALEALDLNEPAALAEELGDLLLQVGLHCEIAAEAGEFDYGDVFEAITTKLIRRHPHVFAGTVVSGSGEVKSNWQRIKQAERTGFAGAARSILAGVALSMPALAYSQAIQERAAQAGFDWPQIEDVLEKLTEEIGELRATTTSAEREDEFGDILFVLVNLARWLGLDAEQSLRHANRKFLRRFTAVEAMARERSIDMPTAGLPALDELWREVKAGE
jgi:tetrapyrrole methylase family protein/MazG family protein